jgi:hypothetical protein
MDDTAHQMLRQIAVSCPQYLRPEDWRRLFRLAVYAHTQHIPLPRHILGSTLMHHGCSLQKAGYLESEIQRFIELLEFYEEHREESEAFHYGRSHGIPTPVHADRRPPDGQ